MVDRDRLISINPAGSNVRTHVVAAELARLTPRDRQLLELLHQHRTFTTEQITDLSFGSLGRARNRLNLLHQREILDRFRHYHRPGSQSWRWTLGPVGAALIAASSGATMPRPAAVRDATARLALSPTLAHLLATNGFFVALTAHARTHHGMRLDEWWSEARCRQATGDLVRPDGHGVWRQGGRVVPFWLEVDLGTETITRVAAKLPGYATLGSRAGWPILFWLPGPGREANLHTHLSRAGVPDGLCVATATPDDTGPTDGPAGPVWRLVGQRGRVTLADLPRSTVDGESWDG